MKNFWEDRKQEREGACPQCAAAKAEMKRLMQALTDQREGFQKNLEEGFEQAYQMLLAEQQKNNDLEARLYQEYDQKVRDVRTFMVNKVDEYLTAVIGSPPDVEKVEELRRTKTAEQIVTEALNQ